MEEPTNGGEPPWVPPPRAIAAGEGPLTRGELEVIVNAIRTSASGGDPPAPIQTMVIDALREVFLGPHVAFVDREVTPVEVGEALSHRGPGLRLAVFHDMCLVGLVVDPPDPDMMSRLHEYARELEVGGEIIETVADLSPENAHVLMVDFARNGYSESFLESGRDVLGTVGDLGDGWASVEDDDALASKWQDLAACSFGTLGRSVHDFYRSRGFTYPGEPGSAPPLLAQHDWVHVLADYGTTLENEIEVFALIGRADANPRSFSLLAMAIGLFGTGAVPSAAGLFESDAGHLADEAMAIRLADAMRRGLSLDPDADLPAALLEVDWFALADLSVDEVRRRFGLGPKSARALEAGSAGPWEVNGFSDYQREHGDLSIIGAYAPWR